LNVVRRDLRAITADGVAANVMVGIGETYLPAFVLAISASQVASGLVATIPMVIGGTLQLCSPAAVRLLGSYRRWAVLTAVLQALGFLPLLVAALVGSMSLVTTFLVVAVYWASGMSCGTAWNPWVGTLVPESIRPAYFAWRTRLTQLGMVLGLAAGGIVLETGKAWGWLPGAFAVLFFVAAASRAGSAYFLSLQREPVRPDGPRLPRPRVLLEAFRNNANSRVILYMLVAQTAYQVAGPYFNPYMLGQLRLSYVHYLLLICIPYVSRSACLTVWGRMVDRIGAHRVLWISGMLIVPLPALWNVSDSFAYLAAVQMFAGLAWAGYELAQLLLFFDAIPARRRVGVLTVYNLLNAVAFFGGSVVGGLLLSELGAGRDAYRMLFLVSTLARVVAMLALVRLPHRAAKPQPAAAPEPPTPVPIRLPQWRPELRLDAPHAVPGPLSLPQPTFIVPVMPPQPAPDYVASET
jgi:MFS family permease